MVKVSEILSRRQVCDCNETQKDPPAPFVTDFMPDNSMPPDMDSFRFFMSGISCDFCQCMGWAFLFPEVIDENEAIGKFSNLNHVLVVVKIENDYLLGWHKWRSDWETFGGLIEAGESLGEWYCPRM